MLSNINADRLWVIGGTAAAALLSVLAWFFLISPQNAETTALQEQTEVQRQRVDSLRRHLTELREQNSKLATYEDELKMDRKALPRTPELAEYLRGLQAAGTATRVTVDALTVGTPTASGGGSARTYAVPLTVTAAGAGVDLERFLRQLQQTQPRATLIGAVNARAEGDEGSLAGSSTVNLTMQVFTTMQGDGATKAN